MYLRWGHCVDCELSLDKAVFKTENTTLTARWRVFLRHSVTLCCASAVSYNQQLCMFSPPFQLRRGGAAAGHGDATRTSSAAPGYWAASLHSAPQTWPEHSRRLRARGKTTHEHQGSERASRSPAAPSRRPNPTPHDKQRPGLASPGGGCPVLGPSSPSQLELQRGQEICPQFLYPNGLRCSEALPDRK